MKIAILAAFVAAVIINIEARASSLADQDAVKQGLLAYLTEEAARIVVEGDRIRGEADRMRSEAVRLNSESRELRAQAAHLDKLWESARRANPAKYHEYVGRDKSQHRMRSDAATEDRDGVHLRHEGRRLNSESIRLWRLAASVDPEAQKVLLDRLQRCCGLKAGIDLLRMRITQMARAAGVNYTPH